MSEIAAIDLPLEKIRDYCATQPIERLSVFGAAFDDFLRPQCDFGMLVEYSPDARVGYFGLAGHEIELGEIIGYRVDLRTPAEVRRLNSLGVCDSARLIYARNRLD